ncbi:class III lanthipeptide [Ligilactobacillus murinus]
MHKVLSLQTIQVKKSVSLRKASSISFWCKTSSHSSYVLC